MQWMYLTVGIHNAIKSALIHEQVTFLNDFSRDRRSLLF